MVLYEVDLRLFNGSSSTIYGRNFFLLHNGLTLFQIEKDTQIIHNTTKITIIQHKGKKSIAQVKTCRVSELIKDQMFLQRLKMSKKLVSLSTNRTLVLVYVTIGGNKVE